MGIDYHFNSLNSARLPILIERGMEGERERERTACLSAEKKNAALKFPGTGHVIRAFWQPLGKKRKSARKRACSVRARFEDVLVALDQVLSSGYF